jgi:hypothetical protein
MNSAQTPASRPDALANEDGVVLIIALVILTIIGLLASALLSFGNTSLRLTKEVRDDRSTRYAADAAIEAAINSIRANIDAGSETGTVPCNYTPAFPINRLNVTVTCTRVTGSGGAGAINLPHYAMLALSTDAAEGINLSGNLNLFVGGGVFSNSSITTRGPLNQLHVRGNITAISPGCATDSNVIAEKGGVKTCGYTGPLEADPGYLPDTPAPTIPAPAPDCVTYSKVVAFSPGLYTSVPAVPGGCNKATWWFKPGQYYFSFPSNTTWGLGNIGLLAGTPKGWDPTTGGAPAFNGDDCYSDDPTKAGAQFVFGGDGRFDLQNGNNAAFEICAPPKPATGSPGPGTQEIAIYQSPTTSNGYAAASGCTVIPEAIGGCKFLTMDNKPTMFILGTVYTPAALVNINLQNLNAGQISSNRGIVARSISINVNPSDRSTAETIQLPANGRAPREVVFTATATASGIARTLLRVDVAYDDGVIGEQNGGAPGRVVSVKSWSVLR